MARKDLPTIKEKNLFLGANMVALPMGIISGLFAGFAVKLINFNNWVTDLIIFFILGAIVLGGQYWMLRRITPVVKKKDG